MASSYVSSLIFSYASQGFLLTLFYLEQSYSPTHSIFVL